MPGPLHTAIHAIVFVAGVSVIALTLLSAVRTVILPRATPTRIGKVTDRAVGTVFRLLSGRTPSYERRDAVFALFGPTQLMTLLASWLLVVFGAGGDRDRAKRPLMGRAAHELADIAIVTDDNPRSEDPAAIRAAVMAGAPGAIEGGDRRAAIRAAVEQLGDGDVLVVAGKGHEQGQTVAGVTHPFDDVAETQAALQAVHA